MDPTLPLSCRSQHESSYPRHTPGRSYHSSPIGPKIIPSRPEVITREVTVSVFEVPEILVKTFSLTVKTYEITNFDSLSGGSKFSVFVTRVTQKFGSIQKGFLFFFSIERQSIHPFLLYLKPTFIYYYYYYEWNIYILSTFHLTTLDTLLTSPTTSPYPKSSYISFTRVIRHLESSLFFKV